MKNADQISFFSDSIRPESESSARNDAESFDSILTFRENAPDMDDAQIMQFILSLSSIRDRATVAASLLDAFGSLKGILEARPEQLRTVKGIGEKTANLIASFLPVMRAWQRRNTAISDRIRNAREAEMYCQSILMGAREERFCVISLNTQCQVIGKRIISIGSLSEVSAYPRIVLETALNYNAHSVLLTHNHPGGTCAPSAEDITSTLQLKRLLNGVGILILDHIIVAGENTYSMIQHGDIDYRVSAQ